MILKPNMFEASLELPGECCHCLENSRQFCEMGSTLPNMWKSKKSETLSRTVWYVFLICYGRKDLFNTNSEHSEVIFFSLGDPWIILRLFILEFSGTRRLAISTIVFGLPTLPVKFSLKTLSILCLNFLEAKEWKTKNSSTITNCVKFSLSTFR